MAVFDKANLFIAGYNDKQVHIGDEGYVFESINDIDNIIKSGKLGHIEDIVYTGFRSTADTSYYYSMFYRTKSVPQKHYIPWTDGTVPDDLLGKVIMQEKDNRQKGIVTSIGVGALVVGIRTFAYIDLFQSCVMSDGAPCGQEVEE
jgi:hypothetical protein